MKDVNGIILDYDGTLKPDLSLLWRPRYAEESRTKYLISKQEICSEVRAVKHLYLCVTDESRIFVGKTVTH